MKPENIALFKRFLKSEGCNTFFAGMYSQSHAKDAPDDVEEFLRQVDAKDAILSAFHFPEENKDFGVQYWFEKAVKWEKILQGATASQFYAYCYHNRESIQREADKPLNRVTAYLHPNIGSGEGSDGLVRALHTAGYSSSAVEREEYVKSLQNDVTEPEKKKLDAWTGKGFQKEEPKPEPIPEIPRGVTEEQMALSGYKMFAIGSTARRHSLPEGLISINTKSGHRVCFNRSVSEEIQQSKHKYIHVFSKDNSLYFLFDDSPSDGLKWRMSEKNVVFSHKDLVINIYNFFGIKEEMSRLSISKNMSKTSKNLFYRITYKKK